jgi:hypothetical protein
MHRISEIEPRGGAPLYQLKITLKWSKPAIWRRLVAPANMKLDRLHRVIQEAMPWTNSHLHQFMAGQTYYGMKGPELDDWSSKTLNEKQHTLADLAPAAKKKFIYEYDFGDGWEHEAVVEKALPPDGDFKQVVCLGGANACPPDDCGGIHGYYRFLEALANPKDPEHDHLKEWIGGEWDAAYFDLDEINRRLKRIKV